MSATGPRPARERASDVLVLKELVEAGRQRAVIDGCYASDQIAEAHRQVETGH